jgi:putative transport protein
MLHYFFTTLRDNPEIALYLTLAIGFSVGQLKLGAFNLGVVTTTLLAGLLVGQIGLTIPAVVQQTFFLAFLFSVGYAVGPQFIKAMRTDGLPQVVFAALVCLSGLATAYILGKLLHYDTALTAGLLSGGYTNSTVLGVATSAIAKTGMDPASLKTALALMPVAYAVTYPFGTVGSAWILAKLAPKLLKIDLVASAREYEAAHELSSTGQATAYKAFSARAYQMSAPELIGKTVSELEMFFKHQLYFRRMCTDGVTVDCTGTTIVPKNATVAVAGSLASLASLTSLASGGMRIGPEVDDKPLLAFPTEIVDVVVTNKRFYGATLGTIEGALFETPGRGIFLTQFRHGDKIMTLDRAGYVRHGDVLTIEGAKEDVATAAKALGFADRQVETTDMAFMAFGIVIGCLIGAISIHIGAIPLSLGTAVGAIIAGIICSYIHGTRRSFGQIPGPALWVFNNVGLNGFIAVVGLNAATGFVSGLEHYGLTLFIAGMIVTIVPLVAGLLLGKFVFKFHPIILLGACAGARSTTAALGALQEASRSSMPAVGYTIGYAVSRIVMAVLAIVLISVY